MHAWLHGQVLVVIVWLIYNDNMFYVYKRRKEKKRGKKDKAVD